MKFTVSSAELLDRLLLTSKAMSSKPIVEVLNNILLKAKDGKLTIMATDLQTTLVSELMVTSVDEEGELAVSRKILDPLQNMPEQPLTITTDSSKKHLKVTFNGGDYSFPYCDAEEYPMIPPEEGTPKMLPASAISDGINMTFVAVGNDEMRPAMNGICFDFHEDNLVFVGTDGSRLIRYTRSDVAAGIESTLIVPKKSTTILKTLLSKESGDVAVSISEKSVSITVADYRLITRLIEGKYPAYNSVIPAEEATPNKVTINRDNLLAAVKRVATMSPPETLLIKFIFSENEVVIAAQDNGFSLTGEERIACQYEGKELTIGFKSKFLLEMVELLRSSDVVIKMSEPGRAGLIVPSEEPDSSAETIMLLMPMHLGDSYRSY